MKAIASVHGKVEVRRTESVDAQEIDSLTRSPVFGPLNVIHLLEKANLAVTMANEKNKILAHASFLDYPIGDLVDPAEWEPFLRKHFKAEKCTPLNTLFLHLFVAQPNYEVGCLKEIVRTIFTALTELQYICLVSPHVKPIEPVLEAIFEPMEKLSKDGPHCLALVCQRHIYCPRLHIRQARVEDHDDLTQIFSDLSEELSNCYGSYSLAEFIEEQDEENHAAVCENEGLAVGFISVTANVDLKLLNDCFELSVFGGLYKEQQQQADPDDATPQGDGMDDTQTAPASALQGVKAEVSVPPPEDVSLCVAAAELQKTQCAEMDESPENPNAFCIHLFVVDKNHEMRSVDFLPYIFKLFPDRDYCVILIPKLSLEFPLLQRFIRVAPHPSCTLDQELYILHRSGLLKSVEVRSALTADRPAITVLVRALNLQQSLLDDLVAFLQARRDQHGTPIQAFVAQVEGQVVGILITRNEEDIEYIRAHYNIENFIYFSHHRYEEHAQMCHFAMNPIFQHYAKHFLKEALRQAHKSCIYHRIYPPNHAQKNSCIHWLGSVLNCLVPVRPRQQIIYPLEELGINAPSRQITKDQEPFALNLISRKLTLEPKVTINTRIVVVGASEIGLAFLEVLAFCPHLRFNNVTLVSTHGFPGDHDNTTGFLSTSHAYSNRDFALLSLRSSINVVTARMEAIDREEKHILVSGSRKVPYDHLVLCSGLQYQVPCPTSDNVRQPVNGSELQTWHRPPRYTGHVPSNLFTLNDQQDCVELQLWLRREFIERDDNAIVYGNSLDVYTSVEALLGLCIHGSRIHMVLPPAAPEDSCFADPHVKQAVMGALEKARVHVHHDCLLAQMNNNQHPEPLTSVSFTTNGPILHLKCGVFINLSSKSVDYAAYQSINDACLMFDERLVVDATFHTNDCTIRAAGPLTKFARRYYAGTWSHADFNSKEVGQDLAAALLPLFDPTLEPPTSPKPEEDRFIPQYKQAKVQGGILPGGYNYLHITKPSTPSARPPLDEQVMQVVTGRVETGNYFSLHLNRFEAVESIICLSLEPFPVSNYLTLYGKHQQLLNHLVARYDQDLVYDLYSFFRESWCMALYHDRFPDFELEVQQILESTTVEDHGSVSMTALVRQLVAGRLEAADDTELLLKEAFKGSGGLASLKGSALNYLRYNRNHLPVYALPGML